VNASVSGSPHPVGALRARTDLPTSWGGRQGRQAVGGAVSGAWSATFRVYRLPAVGPWDST